MCCQNMVFRESLHSFALPRLSSWTKAMRELRCRNRIVARTKDDQRFFSNLGLTKQNFPFLSMSSARLCPSDLEAGAQLYFHSEDMGTPGFSDSLCFQSPASTQSHTKRVLFCMKP